MNCKFCMTGKQGFTANLSAHQILNQIYSIPEREKLTNLVSWVWESLSTIWMRC